MKKLMFAYLNTRHPNAYVYYCQFGYLLYDGEPKLEQDKNNNFVSRHNTINQLETLFDCDKEVAENAFEDWWRTLPMYKRLGYATTELVLVPHKSTSYATTL